MQLFLKSNTNDTLTDFQSDNSDEQWTSEQRRRGKKLPLRLSSLLGSDITKRIDSHEHIVHSCNEHSIEKAKYPWKWFTAGSGSQALCDWLVINNE